MLFNLLFPLLWEMLFVVGGIFFTKKKPISTKEIHFPKFIQSLIPENQNADTNFLIRLGCMITAGEVLFLMLLSLVVSTFMFRYGDYFHVLAIAISTFLPFLFITLKLLLPNKKQLHSLAKSLALCGLVVLGMEVLVFNGKSFTLDKEITALTVEKMTFEESDKLSKENDSLIIK